MNSEDNHSYDGPDDTEPEDDTSSDRWWETASLSSVRATFRETLAGSEPPFADVTGPWLNYWVTANSQGLTRGASKALLLLIESARKRAVELEELCDPSPTMRTGFCRFFARALIALAEQTGIVLPRIEAVERDISSFAARVGLGESDAAAVRMAINDPLGREPEPDDVEAVLEYWRNREEEEGDSAAYCESAIGQILVENLLLLGRGDEALAIARDAVEESPCMSGCALAPQRLLGGCLEPLRRSGEIDLARSWERKLAGAAPPSHTWLAPSGYRARFLAFSGEEDAARQLIGDTDTYTREPQTSAWQRFVFFWGASEALFEVGREAEAEMFRERALQLAFAFDRRNGNESVSRKLLR